MIREDKVALPKRLTNFENARVLVFWETTKACLLSCLHCRAEAQVLPLPGQLSTQEGKQLLEQVVGFGKPSPITVFTGGDALMRNDIFKLLNYARDLGLRTAVSPSVTPLLTKDVLSRLKRLGVEAVSISLDGALPYMHDLIRGVAGNFATTVSIINKIVSMGIRCQVNTAVMRSNMKQLPDIFHLIKSLGVRTWEVFFLIRTGRALESEDLTSEEYESTCNFLYDASRYGVTVRAVEAPFLRRIVLQRNITGSVWHGDLYEFLLKRLLELEGPPPRLSILPHYGTLDGDGIIFVAHDGTVFPGGFLPLRLGNIKEDSLCKIYETNEVLVKIRNRELKGKCGYCPYRFNCGGSRARAFAYYGDPLASDPACYYLS